MKKNTPKPNKDPVSRTAGTKQLGLKVFYGAIFLTFCVFVAVVLVFMLPDPLTTSLEKTPSQNQIPNETPQEPISIIAKKSDGVTIVEKMPEADADTAVKALGAPTQGGAETATNFAIDLGSAGSFLELSRRFERFAKLNDEKRINQWEPRALLRDTENGLQARLLVGPIQTLEAAKKACTELVFPSEIQCEASDFAGELISRSP